MNDTHQITVEILREDQVLAAVPASLRTCVEDARFQAVVTGAVPNDGAQLSLEVEPVWDSSGPPVLAAVRLRRADAPPALYTREVFTPWARTAIVELLRGERVAAGDQLTWRVVARPEPPAPPPRFRGRVERAPYPLHPGTVSWAHPVPGEVAVQITGRVIAALRAATRKAGTIECAALLTGHLFH